MEKLAIDGGTPVSETVIPYGRQTIDRSDLEAVESVMKENRFLTTGPRVDEFEKAVAEYVGTGYGVAVNSGTAALHVACHAADVGPGDEVIVSDISFIASSNAVLYCGGTPVFCDVEAETMNIDVSKIEALITSRTKAIVFVDMCGQPCDYDALREIADRHRLILIEDAAHSIGARYRGRRVGSFADLTTFSFHPVKHITTCEGGMIMTDSEELYRKMRNFRNHGIDLDYTRRVGHEYNMEVLGYNYRMPDLLCALGLNQLRRLDSFIKRRREIAERYVAGFAEMKELLEVVEDRFGSVYHIFVIRLRHERLTVDRDQVFAALRKEGIGVNVHYKPIHRHPFYERLGHQKGLCPVAEDLYTRIITLPVYPTLTDREVDLVIEAVRKVVYQYAQPKEIDHREQWELNYQAGRELNRYPIDNLVSKYFTYRPKMLEIDGVTDYSDARVLEVGCGCGNNLPVFLNEGHPVVGIDVSQTAISHAAKQLSLYSGVELVASPLLDVELPENSVSMVVDRAVITHNPGDVDQLVDQVYRWLKPGGLFYSWVFGANHSNKLSGAKPFEDGFTGPVGSDWEGLNTKFYHADELDRVYHRFDQLERMRILEERAGVTIEYYVLMLRKPLA